MDGMKSESAGIHCTDVGEITYVMWWLFLMHGNGLRKNEMNHTKRLCVKKPGNLIGPFKTSLFGT